MHPTATDRTNHPSAWRSGDFASKDDFSVDLGPRQVTVLKDALAAARRRGQGPAEIASGDFDLGGIADDLALWLHEIAEGRGFVLLRGFPYQDLSIEEIETLYWGLGTHFGGGQTQSVLGDLVGHVRDHSRSDPNARAYRNSQELSLHTDYCTIIAMLSLETAAEGGISRYASGPTIHDEIQASRPELLAPLYEGFHYYRQGEELPGQAPCTEWKVPLFSRQGGYLTIRYVRSFIEAAAVMREEPLTDRQVEALDLVDEIANRADVVLETRLEPGEMMITNNYTTLHARTAFRDDPAAGRARHLLRLWLNNPAVRPVAEALDHFGAGGGIPFQADKQPSGEGVMLERMIGKSA